MQDLTFFLPTRSGSERVKNKNTRPFSTFEGGLLELKLQQLVALEDAHILLSTNSDESIKIAQTFPADRIEIVRRPEVLSRSNTPLEKLIEYAASITQSEHILWTHVTSPFVSSEIYKKAISEYFTALKEGKDSLMSVTKMQEFLWDPIQNKAYNFDHQQQKWPRTQDLKKLYCINSAIFINSRTNYLQYEDRIGKNPYLFELNGREALDIDWEDDFKLAEKLYESLNPL